MPIHISNINDGSIENFLESIDFEELLGRLELVEPIRYTEYVQKNVYHDDALKPSTLSEGEKLVHLMNQDFEDSVTVEPVWINNHNYGVAA